MRPRDSGVERMRDAARRLVDTVTEDLRGRLVRPFEEEDARRHWSYLPGRRPGVHFGELDRDARKAVHALVASGLQPHAYAQVAAIMALEDVLDEQEGSTRGRHNTDYWTVVFGDPEAGGRWGWRFEGHHTSLNLTVEATEVIAATPCFFGANPATVGYGPSPVLRPLGLEEELARAVLASMPGPLLWRAVVSDEAPSDIVTRFEPAVAAGLEPAGVRAGDLGAQPAGARRRPRPRVRRSRVRVGRPPRPGRPPLLQGLGRGPVDRIRQHAERREPHSQRVAGPRPGLRPRRPGPTRRRTARSITGRRGPHRTTTPTRNGALP